MKHKDTDTADSPHSGPAQLAGPTLTEIVRRSLSPVISGVRQDWFGCILRKRGLHGFPLEVHCEVVGVRATDFSKKEAPNSNPGGTNDGDCLDTVE